VKFLDEIRRRKVLQGAFAYAVVGWLLIQLAIAFEDSLELPQYVDRWATIIVLAGFPVAVIVSWFFDISLGGVRFTKQDAPKERKVSSKPSSLQKAAAPKHSIAVLPFADMSQQQDQEYLGDGVAEEILNGLVKVTPLKVSGRTSSFSFKRKGLDIQDIGRELNVAYVLEGSVRKQGDRVRITAQLIKSSDGFHIWSETYDGELSDIFELQDRIAKAIVHALEIALEVDKIRLVVKKTSDLEAYEYFLRGRKLAYKQDGAGVLAEAIGCLQRAVELDPEFSDAWSMLSSAHFWVLEHSVAKNWQDHINAGCRAARRAFDLEKTRFHTFGAMYTVDLMEGHFGDALDRLTQGLAAEPQLPSSKLFWGLNLAAIGLVEEGSTIISEALEQDPRSGSLVTVSGHPLWANGEVEKAKAAYLKGFELGYFGGGFSYAWLLSNVAGASEAIRFFHDRYRDMGPLMKKHLRNPLLRFVFSEGAFKKRAWCRWVVSKVLERLVKSQESPPSIGLTLGLFYAGNAELYLDTLRNKPHPYMSATLMHLWLPAPESKSIRMHPDFPKFADDIGLVKAWQTYGWPKQVRPHPGTDGSNLQFTVS
jgi:TolB-like protein